MIRRASRLILGLALLAASAVVAPGGARADLVRLYGEENVGTAGGQFLKVPVGARAVGLGKAYVACAIDGPATFWNPAGILRTPGRVNFFAAHTAYVADIALNHAAVHWRRQNWAFGISAGMLRSGDILRTTERHMEGTGDTFNADQYQLGFTVGRAMTDRFSIALTGKYLQENLDEWAARAVLFDVGLLYFLGWQDLRVGFAVRNIGGDIRPGGQPPLLGGDYPVRGEFQAHAPPTEGAFGAAATWGLGGPVDLLTTADFNHPSDAKETLRTGAELGLWRLLYLRGGFEFGRDEGGLGAGFGLQLRRKKMLWRIDYGYGDMGAFGTVHHVTLELSPLWPRELRRHGRAR